MDNSFLSAQNIDNIYEYINTEMIKNHKINLNNDAKNKKIIKKLTKTVFDKLQTDLDNNGKKNIVINNFNDMVVQKCVPFLLNKSKTKNTSNKEKRKPKKYSVKKQLGVKNINLNIGEAPTDYKKRDNQTKTFQQYINNANDFELLVKESNKQINDSFKAYSQKQSVFNSHDSINSSCNSDVITNDFVVDRCATKDDIDSNRLDKNAFNEVVAKKILNKSSPPQSNSAFNNYNNYGELNARELLTKILVNQTDHSNNELKEYEGELYLPNLISEVGDEAPIQPLLYQNTKQGDERIQTKVITIDTGDRGTDNGGKLDLTAIGSPAAVTNLSTNRWYKFRVNLQETFKIDKLSDIYIKSFTLVGATTKANAQYFAINIEELNAIRPSNNKYLKDKLIFKNTNTSNGNTNVVSHDYGYKSYFFTTVNPESIYNLTFELTNENNEHNDSGDNKTFASQTAGTNRVILELEIYPRDKPNEIIFDRTPYGSALNAELSNT